MVVFITWLHHTHREVPHMGAEAWSRFRGATQAVDRPSYPALLNTFGCTIPAPIISIHPDSPHTRHPLPEQVKQSMLISTPGSTKGK